MWYTSSCEKKNNNNNPHQNEQKVKRLGCGRTHAHTLHYGRITSVERHDNSCSWFYMVMDHCLIPNPRNACVNTQQSTHIRFPNTQLRLPRLHMWLCVIRHFYKFPKKRERGLTRALFFFPPMADGNDEKCVLWNPVWLGLLASGGTPFPYNQELSCVILVCWSWTASKTVWGSHTSPREIWCQILTTNLDFKVH